MKKRKTEPESKGAAAAVRVALKNKNLVGLVYSFGTVRDWHNWTAVDKAVWRPQLDVLRPCHWRAQLPWIRGLERVARYSVLLDLFRLDVEALPDNNDNHSMVRCSQCRDPKAAIVSQDKKAAFIGDNLCGACFALTCSETDDAYILDTELRAVCVWRARASCT